MIKTIENIEILGLSAAVPANKMTLDDFSKRFDEKSMEKIRKVVGVTEVHITSPNQTASDLAYVAAENLKSKGLLDVQQVDAVIFVTQSPDYVAPCTAAVLAYRLGLPRTVIAFDVSVACTGFLSGLTIATSYASIPGLKKVLLLGGDCLSKLVSPLDKTSAPLFGDAGYACVIERTDAGGTPIHMNWETDGSRFKANMTPGLMLAGRHPCIYAKDGISRDCALNTSVRDFGAQMVRGDEDFYMDGMALFDYTANDAPLIAKAVMDSQNLTADAYDYLVVHQANLFIMKQAALELGFPKSKVPISIDRYGNNSGASIPITLCDMNGTTLVRGPKHLLMLAFGAGLATTAVDVILDFDKCMPIIESDEAFDDGGLNFVN